MKNDSLKSQVGLKNEKLLCFLQTKKMLYVVSRLIESKQLDIISKNHILLRNCSRFSEYFF